MNIREQEIYNNLLALVTSNETFYYQDFTLDNKIYRIFNYRLASYTNFLAPDAKECRGIMFELNVDGSLYRLACRPPEKFWNYLECPATMNIDLTDVVDIELKVDGSLISTYMHNGDLRLKSKGSLSSQQANDAMAWLFHTENKNLYSLLKQSSTDGYTVNCEWLSPNNRIVIGYEKDELKVLNIRNMIDGSYLSYNELLVRRFPTFGSGNLSSSLCDYWTDKIKVDNPIAFVASIPDMTDNIEGYVLLMASGQRMKIKTKKYLALHHTKDSINSRRRLFECIIQETADDLKAMFFDDQIALKLISDMEDLVLPKFNAFVKQVEDFYEANKGLDRKSYAIKGQQELKNTFSLAMSKYLGKEVNFKEWAVKHIEHFGVKDEVLRTVEE